MASTSLVDEAGLALKLLFNAHLDQELPSRLSEMIRDAINNLAETTDEKLAELTLRAIQLEEQMDRRDHHPNAIRTMTDVQAQLDDLSGKIESLIFFEQRIDGLSEQFTQASSRVRVLEEKLNTLTFNVMGVDHELHDTNNHMHHVDQANMKLKEGLKSMRDRVATVDAENHIIKSSLGNKTFQLRAVEGHIQEAEDDIERNLHREKSHMQDIGGDAKHQRLASRQMAAADNSIVKAAEANVIGVLNCAAFADRAVHKKGHLELGLVKQLTHEKMPKMQQGMTINVRLEELEDKLHQEIEKNRQQELLYEQRNETHIKHIEDHVEAIEEKITVLRGMLIKEPTGQYLDVTFHTNPAIKTARLEAEVAQLNSKYARLEEGFTLLLLASDKLALEHSTAFRRYSDSQSRLEATTRSMELMYGDLRGAIAAELRGVKEVLGACAQQPQYEELKQKIEHLHQLGLRNEAELLGIKSRPDAHDLDLKIKNTVLETERRLLRRIEKLGQPSLLGGIHRRSNQDEEEPVKPALTTMPIDPRPQHCLSCMRDLPVRSREALVEGMPLGVEVNKNARSFESMLLEHRYQLPLDQGNTFDAVRYGTTLDPPLHTAIGVAADADTSATRVASQQRTVAIDALRASDIPIWRIAPLKSPSGGEFRSSLDKRKARGRPSRGVPTATTARTRWKAAR